MQKPFRLARNRCASLLLAILVLVLATAQAEAAEPTGISTEWGRSFERILIVVAGALSMLYGFKLFSIIASNASEMTARAGEWQLKLVRVGPGVFFALFGAAILIYAMSQSPSIIIRPVAQEATLEIRGAVNVDIGPVDIQRESLQAITTISRVVASGDAARTPQVAADLKHAVDKLEPIKKMLVDQRFGSGAYSEWSRLTNAQQLPGDTSFATAMNDADVRKRFNQVDAALSEAL